MNGSTATGPNRVIAFAGLPGTGKSTLAEGLARETGTPVFSGDWLMGSLVPHGVLDDLERDPFIALHDGLLETLITRQLLMGQSAVVDCVVDDALAGRWARLAAEHGAELRVVECVCSDTALHRSRVEGRTRGIPGWHEIDWDHVERMRVEYPRLTVDRLTLDAVDSLEDNLAAARAFAGV